MSDETAYQAGVNWNEHYRGLRLHINGKKEMWWRQYNGEQRLFVADPPNDLVEKLIDHKPLGGRVHITEQGTVIAKREDDEDDIYEQIYIGELNRGIELHPGGDADFAVTLTPTDLEVGDLWPSVYDGAKYSLTASDEIWWNNPQTKQRHAVTNGIPEGIAQEILLRKNRGGSFRITPWGDVITLIEAVPDPGKAKEQFSDLPRAIQNIIQLRSERGLEMLPIYVGTIDEPAIELTEPRDLTSKINSSEWDDIEQWIESLGPTGSAQDGVTARDETAEFDDDPEGWAEDYLETEETEDE